MLAAEQSVDRPSEVFDRSENQYRLLWFVILDPHSGECSGAGMRFINFARELTRSGVSVYFAVNCWPGQDVQSMREYLSRLKDEKVIAGSFILQYRYSHRQGTIGALAFHPGLTNIILKSVRSAAVDSICKFAEANEINVFINSDRMLLFLGPALMGRLPVICDWTDSLVLYYLRALNRRIRDRNFKGLIGFIRDFQTNLIAEIYYGRRSTFNLAVSPVDKEWLDWTNFRASKNRLVMNGAKMPAYSAVAKTPKRLIFSGVMDFAPNYEGALWFLNEVFPLVLKKHPDSTFVLAGMNPPRELKERANEHIHVTGFVDDMGAEISCSSLYVAPMISGGGFKNKIIEAIVNGTYVVGTRLSVEFLAPEVRNLLSVVRTAEEMATAINTFLDDPSQFDERLKQIQATIRSQFSWRNQSLDFLHLLADAHAVHFAPSPMSERDLKLQKPRRQAINDTLRFSRQISSRSPDVSIATESSKTKLV